MFRFRWLLVVVGLALCAAEKPGVLTKKELVLRKLSRMEGMVADIGKFPLADSSVTVQRLQDSANTPLRVELKTAEDGKFMMDALAPGKYEVQASHKGFKTVTKPFTLEPGKVTKAVVSLSLTLR